MDPAQSYKYEASQQLSAPKDVGTKTHVGTATSSVQASAAPLTVSAPPPHRPERNTSTCPFPPVPPHQKIPPSFPAKSDRPKSPSSPDRDCADYSSNCHTKPPPAAESPPSILAAPPACNSTASESDNSPAAASPRFHRHAQCHIQTAFRADAYAEKDSAR